MISFFSGKNGFCRNYDLIASNRKPSEDSKIPLKRKKKLRETEKDYSLLNLKIKRAPSASFGKVMSWVNTRYITKLDQAKGKFENRRVTFPKSF